MPSLITPSAQEIKAIERDVAPLFQRPCGMSRRSSKRLSYRVIAPSVQESDQEGHRAAPLGDRATVPSLRAREEVSKRDAALLLDPGS